MQLRCASTPILTCRGWLLLDRLMCSRVEVAVKRKSFLGEELQAGIYSPGVVKGTPILHDFL